MNLAPADMVNTIICGDNVAALKQLPDECIGMSLQSPPYDPVDGDLNVQTNGRMRDYEGYSWNFKAVAAELYRVTKPGGVAVWVVGDATVNGSETGSSFRQALYFMALGFRLYQTIHYRKPPAVPTTNRYYNSTEYMFVFSKGAPKSIHLIQDRPNKYAGGKRKKDKTIAKGTPQKGQGYYTYQEFGRRTNVWDYQPGNSGKQDVNLHPAPFPEELARDHILSWSNPGDLVLDCFVGSGTTAKMAALLDRKFIGIEVSEKYAAIARERVRRVQLQPKLIPFVLPLGI